MEQAISRAYIAGGQQWPAVTSVTRDRFTEHVIRVGATEGNLDAHGADLYLALACGLGDSAAMRLLTVTFFPNLERHLARAGIGPVDQQESLQKMLVHLCTGPAPRILSYAGRASLLSWLRVAAMRHALDEARRNPPTEPNEDEDLLTMIVDGGENPERKTMVETIKPAVQAALLDAMAALSSRDRTLLHMFFREGMKIEAIGQVYGIHRATVARQLKEIRERILAHVRVKVGATLGANTEEVDSLVGEVRSQINVSLWRLVSTRNSTAEPRTTSLPR